MQPSYNLGKFGAKYEVENTHHYDKHPNQTKRRRETEAGREGEERESRAGGGGGKDLLIL